MDTDLILRSSDQSHCKRNKCRAFTRLELFVCVVCTASLAAVVFPALATTRSRSDVVQCLNNLRQVGRALAMWGSDHGNAPPWQTYTSDGGTRTGGTKVSGAWQEFASLSNELVTPRILSCTADSSIVARDFGQFTSAAFRAAAISYFINLHTLPEFPTGPLFGDRNVSFPFLGSCDLGYNNVHGAAPSDTSVAWTNAVHGFQGNLVTVDGSVAVTTSADMRNAFGRSNDRNVQHILRGGP
jgi:hypothetical protein